MESLQKILVLAVVFAAVGSTVARVFVFDDGRPEQRAQRSKRQVLAQNVPEAIRGVSLRSPRQSAQELGYDASDILRPPGVELAAAESRYRTLSYKRSRPEFESPPIVWGTPKEGAVVSRPQRSSREGTPSVSPAGRESQDEEDEEEEDEEDAAGYSQEGHSYHQVPASIYSFVKTDPHGNFKWGVHRGPPSRG